jgi:hypothetical protein
MQIPIITLNTSREEVHRQTLEQIHAQIEEMELRQQQELQQPKTCLDRWVQGAFETNLFNLQRR